VGAGAGFPGIPLKIAFPGLRLALLEATLKKASFLTHVVKELALQDTQVIAERAEDAARRPEHRETYDIVVARALAPMAALTELTLPFCKPGGCVVAMKKGDIAGELAGAQRAIALLGGRLREVKPVSAPGLEDGRALVIVDKVAPTPAAYPRRAGLPAKRPLS
jgi:16S rRNA (guanine527-N7)-methyltransferase